MSVYIGLNIIILIFLFSLSKNRIQNVGLISFILFAFFFVVAGFRHYSVGGDTSTYVSLYEVAPLYSVPSLMELFSSRFEPGFIVLNQWLYQLSPHYTLMLATYAFLTLGIYFYVMHKQSYNVVLSVFLFFTFMLYAYTLSNIRQSLAIALVMLSFHYWIRHQRWRAWLAVILATLFHTSAPIFILVFLISSFKLNRFILWLSVAVALPLYQFVPPIMVRMISYSEKYQSYLETDWFSSSNKLSLILKFVIVLLIFIVGEVVLGQKFLTFYEQTLRKIMYLAVIFSFLNIQTALIGRFTMYFSVFIILYVPLIIAKMKQYQWRVVFSTVIMLGFMAYFYAILVFRPDWLTITPYQTVLIDWIFY